MDELIASEARGDASNLKGTDYHLLYALWLLLGSHAEKVSFFAGNDLLATPTAPPDEAVQTNLSVAVLSAFGNRDDWIQLKCTSAPWTVSELLKGNLLDNLICNSFVSESNGRSWQACLITTAEIRAGDIANFAANPSAKPREFQKFECIVDRVAERLSQVWHAKSPTRDSIAARAAEVCKAVAECETLPRRVIEAEIRTSLVNRLVDETLAAKLQQQLVGALLRDAATATRCARVYDRDWVRSIAGRDFWRNRALDESVALACDEQVRDHVPPGFSAGEYAPRASTVCLISEFLDSAATAFVLSGGIGTGKSWTVVQWAFVAAKSRARLLIPGRLVTERSSLFELVAQQLRPMTEGIHDIHCLCEKLARPASKREFGPLVIVIDDIRPSMHRPDDFSRNIATIVDDARANRIKLLITCNSDVIRNLRPFGELSAADVFHAEPRIRAARGESPPFTPSCILDDFTDGELADAIGRRVDDETAQRLVLRLRDPAFSPLRNPYALGVFLSEAEQDIVSAPGRLCFEAVGALIDRRIDGLISKASKFCNLHGADIREILSHVTMFLWDRRGEPVEYIDLCHELESRFGSSGKIVLNALGASGILSFSSEADFSDQKIRARLFARHVYKACPAREQLVNFLRVEGDHDVAVQLLPLLPDPVKVGSRLVDVDTRWIPACSEGLACCNPNDRRITAALLAFARRELDGWSAADALGRFALASRAARCDIMRRFLGQHGDDRRIAERALFQMNKFGPDLVARAVRMRFRRVRPLPNNREEKADARRALAHALRTLSGLDSVNAARHSLAVLARVTAHAVGRLGQTVESIRLQEVLSDPLLAEYDQIRTIASAYCDPQAFEQFLVDLTSIDVCRRARAVNALEVVGRELPDRVRAKMIDVLRTEKVPMLLARAIWDSCRLAEADRDAVMCAIESNALSCWQSYESAAATLGLLDLIAPYAPHGVWALIPESWDGFDSEARLLLKEFALVCRHQCRQAAKGTSSFEISPANEAVAGSADRAHLLYILRVEIVELLLQMGDDVGLTHGPMFWRMEFRDDGQDFFTVDMSGWIKGKEDAFALHPCSREVVQKIVAVAHADHNPPANVLDGWRRKVRFYLVRDCLDVLVEILRYNHQPDLVVAELPHDWEILYVCGRLLEARVQSVGLIDLAIAECESHRNSATAQATSERTHCLVALQKIAPDRVPEIHEERHGLGWFFSGGKSTGSRLISQIEEQPENAVALLESAIRQPTDAMMLADWNSTARSWATASLSIAYSRMFNFRPILPSEATEMAESVIMALGSFPQTQAGAEHLALYSAILQYPGESTAHIPAIRGDSDPIVQSHRLAAEILSAASVPVTAKDVRHFFFDKRGWWEESSYRWAEDGRIEHGSGVSYHFLVFFPAVRLALCAIGRLCRWIDPAHTWTHERRKATLISKDMDFGIRHTALNRTGPRQRIEQALRELPDQDRLYSIYGHLLLQEGDPENARMALEKAIESPLVEGRERGAILYNLACAFARLGNTEECYRALIKAKEFGGVDAAWARQDADLDSVKGSVRFDEIIKNDRPAA